MTYEFNTGPDNFEFEEIVAYSWLPGPATGRADINRLLPLASGLPDHISCQGPDGACLMTTGPSNTGATPFEAEIGIVHLDGTFVRLTQHHSTECGYFSQPRATWSRDGRFAIFASDWGNDRCDGGDYAGGRPDPYIIELF